MPTIQIKSDISDLKKRRNICRKMTVVFGRLGVDVRHLLILWQPITQADIYPGPLSIAEMNKVWAGPIVYVSVAISNERPAAWRAQLLQELSDLFADGGPGEYVFIELLPVAASDFSTPVSRELQPQKEPPNDK
ncbi:hypothetical protein FS799_16135 [Agrobacterium vitis]|uniref:hypothetical protein n=1 Tax=Agrobacterium vitis TaxID=373 RepID=UPI001F1C0546|nr:hypothetical protein [Agrobacterium vitis]MCE6076400.1 hypothetical protein [Agrobacterium vitis]